MINKIKKIIRVVKTVWRGLPKKIRGVFTVLIASTLIVIIYQNIMYTPCSVNLEDNPIKEFGLNPSTIDYGKAVKCYFQEFIRRINIFQIG